MVVTSPPRGFSWGEGLGLPASPQHPRSPLTAWRKGVAGLAEHSPVTPLCSVAGDGWRHHQAEDLYFRCHVLHQLLPHGELPQARGPGVPVHREVRAGRCPGGHFSSPFMSIPHAMLL